MTDNLHQEFLRACRTAFRGSEACGKVLLLGEDNPISSAPEHALFPYPEGCSGERLCNKVLGLRRATHLALWRTNLCVGGWSMPRARERAHALLSEHAPWSVVVLLGAKVREAIGYEGAFFTYGTRYGWSPGDAPSRPFTLVSLPHPSGRNLVWNNPARCVDARMLLREVAPDVPWGEAFEDGRP